MKKSIGLPGGPNEYLQNITSYISVEGYKRDSPDVNNPYNIIESGNITMEGVDFAVKGIDNLGNELIMKPGGNYQFPGDSVLETPLAQAGEEVGEETLTSGFFNYYQDDGPMYGPKEEPPKSALPELFGTPKITKNDNVNFPFAKPKVVTVFAETPNGYVPLYDLGNVQDVMFQDTEEYKRLPEDLKKQYDKGRKNVSDALIKYEKESKPYVEIIDGYNFSTEEYIKPGSKEFLEYHTAKNKLSNLTDKYKKVTSSEQKIFNTITDKQERVAWNLDTFITEAENVKEWYKKNEPSTVVNVIPFYGDPDVIRNNTINLNPEDDIIMMGHSGDKIGGVPNGEISDILSQSPATDCFMGSCSFEGYASDYNLRKGQTLSFRPESPWLGFDPTADTFEKGMWGRNYANNKGDLMNVDTTESVDSYTPQITELKDNITSKTTEYKRGGGLLDKTMSCNSCGWEWKAADGGADVSTCHKCGGSALPKAQDGTETEVNSEYKVQSGDTFYGIANKNNVSREILKNANPNINIENLGLNQNIIIPKKIDRSPPMPETNLSKISSVLDYNAISNYLVDSRGGTTDTWGQLADTIAYHESSPWSRMDPKAKQYQGGPGRGLFQFEGASFNTALKRYKNVANAKGFTIKDSIVNAKSADELSAEDQYVLFYANLIESKTKLSDFVNGNISSLDVWLSGHKNVEADGDRASFLESRTSAEKEGIKNGYKTFEDGGETSVLNVYKNYINGVYNNTEKEIKAEKLYDKLNRNFYKQAKELGMSPGNFIMTHIIGNS